MRVYATDQFKEKELVPYELWYIPEPGIEFDVTDERYEYLHEANEYNVSFVEKVVSPSGYDDTEIRQEIAKKADKTEEVQIKGWTAITSDTYEELDLREYLPTKHKFTIIVYIRKSNIRQAVKFELTTPELNKILSKVKNNMVCITRSCVDPTNANKIAMLKQCMEKTETDGIIKLKYAIFNTDGTMVTGLDNYEWCFYAE